MISLNLLLKYKVHIGHTVKNTSLFTTWFLYKLRYKTWIINIFKTILFLKIVFKFLAFIVNNNLPIWFLNLEITKSFIFQYYAIHCGEFYCTKYWIRGLLSNFKNIQESINKYVMKQYVLKSNAKAFFIKNWWATRFTWPRCVLLSNIKSNYVIANEAGSISLPVIAIVDSNVKNFLFKFPIPSNTTNLKSLCFVISLISKQVLLSKYKQLLNWYTFFKIKKNKYNLFNKLHKTKKIFLKTLVRYNSVPLDSLNLLRNTISKFNDIYRSYNKKLDSTINFNISLMQLYKKHNFIRQILTFSWFFKMSMANLKLYSTKAYKKNIINFIKYNKFHFILNNKKVKYKKKEKLKFLIFRKFFSLHFFYVINNFKLSKVFYESFFTKRLLSSIIIHPIKRIALIKDAWKQKRFFEKKNMKAIPKYLFKNFFIKFFIKINKYNYFQPKFNILYGDNFNNELNYNKLIVQRFTKMYFSKWFFLFLNKNKHVSF